jgi:hypothetical protein
VPRSRSNARRTRPRGGQRPRSRKGRPERAPVRSHGHRKLHASERRTPTAVPGASCGGAAGTSVSATRGDHRADGLRQRSVPPSASAEQRSRNASRPGQSSGPFSRPDAISGSSGSGTPAVGTHRCRDHACGGNEPRLDPAMRPRLRRDVGVLRGRRLPMSYGLALRGALDGSERRGAASPGHCGGHQW